MANLRNSKIAVIGLGYVGLPLAVEFGKLQNTIGFDLNPDRITDLKSGRDHTMEVEPKDLVEAKNLDYTTRVEDLRDAEVYIVTVPTPIDINKQPDLGPLLKATEMIGSVMTKGDIIIFESTVYPGATEEKCVPVLERTSGFEFNTDFFCGYSPERINPGDKTYRLKNIVKVTSGSTPLIADAIDDLYSSIIIAGTFKAQSIKIAEAAKVIENTQRDLNIALMNELSMIFSRMGLDTDAVLRAAETKWNFLSFRPGLVGGHCIGVDPYYLTYKAQAIGYHPEVILAGRRINDGMGKYVAGQLIKLMIKRQIQIERAKVLVLGFAFKENCSDARNTRVVDIVRELEDFSISVKIFDPLVCPRDIHNSYGIDLLEEPPTEKFDAIILAVPHHEFVKHGASYVKAFGKNNHVFYDVKHVFRSSEADLFL